MSRPVSLRLPESTLDRLAIRSRRSRMPPRTLAQRYVEEGLRMDEHPLVRFVDGPAGRRPQLLGGPEVSDVVTTLRDNEGDVAAAAEYLELPVGAVEAAAAYYGAFRAEVDEWITVGQEESEDAHARWAAGRAAFGT